MREYQATILENKPAAENIYSLTLALPEAVKIRAGQFADLSVGGAHLLKRPLAVCKADGEKVTVCYQIRGEGTKLLSERKAGETLDALLPLGNGFYLKENEKKIALVGGGVGIPPLYGLAKRLTAQGKRVTAVLGFNRASEIVLAEEFRALGAEVVIATADGSAGIHGLVTDGMAAVSDYTYLYTCGPEPMLKAVYDACKTSGQFSFEERMGCGFGACMGCSCETKYGNKRICKDGPVLEKEEIVW